MALFGKRRRRPAEIRWQGSRALASAVAAADLRNLRFELADIRIELGTLVLTFRALQPVSEDLARQAGWALRCVVGLTLPSLAASVRGVDVVHALEYTVALGDGVRVPAVVLRCGADRAGPFQVTSDEEDAHWLLYVQPVVVPVSSRTAMADQEKAQTRVFQMIAPAFDELRDRPISLAG